MNGILRAMDETVALAELRGMAGIERLEPTASFAHLKNMQCQMHDQPMDDGKLNRWLGWAQCAVVVADCATLDDMREIGKRIATFTEDKAGIG